MVDITIAYQGQLRCAATHGPSGAVVLTDAPVDNHGKGESFSPTDLLATALGTCMITVMGIAAQALQVELTGATVAVRKDMAAKPIRRIGTLTVVISVPVTVTEDQKHKLEKAAMTCPVHQSLHPDVQMPIEFRWGQ